mgnify:CR=1 FL=1
MTFYFEDKRQKERQKERQKYKRRKTKEDRDRRQKKRMFRKLWIMRINAAARLHGMSYSEFIGKLKSKNIDLNRKVLADLAMNNPEAFKAIIDKIN